MSETPRRKPPAPNPVAAKKPAAAAATSDAKPKAAAPAGARRKQIIQVHREDLERDDKPLAERIKDEAKSGLPGLLISLGFHSVILLLLAVIVIRSQSSVDPNSLEMGWLPQSVDAASSAEASRAPVRIGTFNPAAKKVEPPPQPSSTSENAKPSNSAPVKPAPAEKTLANRSPRMRSNVMEKNGGSNRTELAVKAALGWIEKQQGARGNWQLHTGYPDAGSTTIKSDCGATALALLAFLGAGHTHQEGEFRGTVEKGIRWLASNQDDEGNLHEPTQYGWRSTYYAHSMATIALCEAYALTGDETLRDPCERAVRFLIDSQHPIKGGWKYVKQRELTNGDLSVTSWALMALNTARMGGIEVPEEAYQRTSFFIDSVQEFDGARYKYEPTDPVTAARAELSAVGLLCRQWLGWPRDFPVMQQGVQYLLQEEGDPQWANGRRNVYGWYYMAQVLHNLDGDEWKPWYKKVHDAILSSQEKGSKEDVRGSWNPNKPSGSPHEYGQLGGRLYITTMCVLILETPIRHHPIYAEPPAENAAASAARP